MRTIRALTVAAALAVAVAFTVTTSEHHHAAGASRGDCFACQVREHGAVEARAACAVLHAFALGDTVVRIAAPVAAAPLPAPRGRSPPPA